MLIRNCSACIKTEKLVVCVWGVDGRRVGEKERSEKREEREREGEGE